MLFNSYEFIFLFLPITWLLFRLVSAFHFARTGIALLILASLIFYSYWNPPFVLLIAASISFNFMYGKILERKEGASLIKLWVGIAINLGLIGYFKYAGFIIENVNWLLNADFGIPNMFLPLGISFFTFQQVAYLVDCYNGRTEEKSLLNYCLFVTFFPQLIAGPIVHHREMMPQFADKKILTLHPAHLSKGFFIFSVGLFKKVIIADTLSPWVAQVFDNGADPMMMAAWVGVIAYTLQIYFDFSGYTDMAIGIGHLFNIELPVNFDAPYKSKSIVEFWRRWHITLSRFLKDYLYIPLGGNRKGTLHRYVNLMLTMFLGGLWHGAAWTFVFWGMLHGTYLCINHAWGALCKKMNLKLPTPIAWMFTFTAVVVAWVFFRAENFDKAISIIKSMMGLNGVEVISEFLNHTAANDYLPMISYNEKPLILIALLVICVTFPVSWRFGREKLEVYPFFAAFQAAAMYLISIMSLTRISEFLYFQF